MAGGRYSERGPGTPLGRRAAPSGSEPVAEVTATPCWLEPPDRVAGSVLGWRRDPESGWQALVAAWVPAGHLHPRSP
jgi:hypothetical protein